MITKYVTLKSTSDTELDKQVNDAISKGWQPLGGVAVSEAVYAQKNSIVWAQAMVLMK